MSATDSGDQTDGDDTGQTYVQRAEGAADRTAEELRDAKRVLQQRRAHLYVALVGIALFVAEQPAGLDIFSFNLPTTFYTGLFFAVVLLMGVSRRTV